MVMKENEGLMGKELQEKIKLEFKKKSNKKHIENENMKKKEIEKNKELNEKIQSIPKKERIKKAKERKK